MSHLVEHRAAQGATPRSVAGLLGALVAVVAVLATVGWWLDSGTLTRVNPRFVPIKPNAAAGALLAGAALAIWSWRPRSRRSDLGVCVAGVAVAALGALTLVEYAAGVDLRIDRLLLPAGGDADAVSPGRMAWLTAVVLVASGVGIVALVNGRRRPVHLLAAAAMVIGYVALLGYLYGVSSLYQVGAYSQMSLHMAAAACALGVALELSIPGEGLSALLDDDGSAGRITQTLIPAVAVTIPLLGWVVLSGQRQGWYEPAFTTAVVAASVGVIGSALTLRAATAALRSDRRKLAAEHDLEALASTLERRVAARTQTIGRAARDLAAVYDAAPVGMLRLDARQQCVAVNAEWLRMTDLRDSASLGVGWHGAIHPDDREPMLASISAAISSGGTGGRAAQQPTVKQTCRLLTPTGPRTTVYAVRPVDDEAGGGHIATFADVHDETEALRALHAAQTRLAAAFHASSLGILLVDLDGRVLEANERLAALTGLDPAGLVGCPVSALLAEQDRHVEEAVRSNLLAGRQQTGAFECRLAGGPGQPDTWVSVNIALVGGAGRRQYFVTQLDDITARRHAEEELAHVALHDTLTGLPNRLLLLDRLEHALRRAERSGGWVAVLFLDLDLFKSVNDRLGHQAGDEVLRAAAAAITTAARPADTVSRLGGDEFVVVCEDLAAAADAVQVAERCRRAIAAPQHIEGVPLTIQSSIGISLARGRYVDPHLMLRDADAAMYEAKARGRGRCVVFDERIDQRLTRRRTAEFELGGAVQRSELVVHYQPIIRLDTRIVTGVEALVRWHPPHGPALLATDFIGVAEQSGLISDIGEFVLTTACHDAMRWNCPDRGVRMSVNVSARQLSDSDFVGLVRRVLRETRLPAAGLCVELAEGVLVDDDAARPLVELREMGVHVAIDDFGTGFSSLGYLRSLPVDVLKIDRMFLEELPGSTRDLAIVTGIVELGRAMGLDVVAEGVERPEQVATLLEVGCDYAQGFLFGEAVAADDVLDPAAAQR